MSINSLENKKMIWDLLSPTFPDNLSIRQRMKTFLDTISETLHKDRFKYKSNIMQMNKVLLSESKRHLTKCTTEIKVGQKKVQQVNKTQQINVMESRNYDKFTTKKEHTITFESRLRDKQENFNKLIDGKTPKSIDFSDKIDKPISTMNSLIDTTLEEREKELNSITQNYNQKDVENWLTNGGKANGAMVVKQQQSNIEIKNEIQGILKPIEIAKEVQKKVTFEVEEQKEKKPGTSTFFSRLKHRSDSSDRELLQQIIENQKTLMEQNAIILEHLNKSNSGSLTFDN